MSIFCCWYLFVQFRWYNKTCMSCCCFIFGSGFSLAFLKGNENYANEMFHILSLLLAPWPLVTSVKKKNRFGQELMVYRCEFEKSFRFCVRFQEFHLILVVHCFWQSLFERI